MRGNMFSQETTGLRQNQLEILIEDNYSQCKRFPAGGTAYTNFYINMVKQNETYKTLYGFDYLEMLKQTEETYNTKNERFN